MESNYKIFKLLSGLQKEVDNFKDDPLYSILNFCNTVYRYVDDIREELNKTSLTQKIEEERELTLTQKHAELKNVLLETDAFKEIMREKKCILCDQTLSDQNYQYPTNHYLCSYECTQYYLAMSTWNKQMKTFILNEEMLNNLRLKNNLKPIGNEEIDKRIDRVVIKDEG